MPNLFFRLRIRTGNLAELIDDLGELENRVKKHLLTAFNAQGRQMAQRIRSKHFGADETGPPVFGAPLRSRSGYAMASVDFLTGQTKDKVWLRVGGMNADDSILRYFETQEVSRVVYPKHAAKLAYPPADAGWPTRDERGVQILTARDLYENAEELGYAYIKTTEEAILGKPVGGTDDFELLFIRVDSAFIPRRAPVLSEKKETETNVADFLDAMEPYFG